MLPSSSSAWRAGLLLLGHLAATRAAAQQPRWERELVVWEAMPSDPAPWRTDPRLAGRFHPEYPDDIQVGLLDPAAPGRQNGELLWVRVIAMDSASGQFLGYSLNQPFQVKGLNAGDNLVLRWDPKEQVPIAVDRGQGAGRAGWPARMYGTPHQAALLRAIAQYRTGAMGHNQPAMVACIATLDPVAPTWPATGPAAERWLAHFIHARCLSETYRTADALAAFRRAIQAAPDSVDSQMGLLADLTVMLFEDRAKLPAGTTEADWERQFIAQRDLVAARFGRDPNVARALRLMRDEAAASPGMTAEARAKGRRTSFGRIRWKQR